MLWTVIAVVVLWTGVRAGLTNRQFEEYKRTHFDEFSGAFEGDIIRGKTVKNAYAHARKWPQGKVVYDMSEMSTRMQQKIRSALKQLKTRVGSCIEFIERTNQRDYISIYSGYGCRSSVGMQGGTQYMSLQESRCSTSIQHEFLHALGFKHEQSRSDRDKYLTINWGNIQPGKEHNFDIANTNNQGLPYEYESIMHYGRYAFSSNGEPTMEPKDSAAYIGARKLHTRDVEMVQKFYGCPPGSGIKPPTCFDESPKCPQWKKKKWCTDRGFAGYMSIKCRKTCGFCNE